MTSLWTMKWNFSFVMKWNLGKQKNLSDVVQFSCKPGLDYAASLHWLSEYGYSSLPFLSLQTPFWVRLSLPLFCCRIIEQFSVELTSGGLWPSPLMKTMQTTKPEQVILSLVWSHWMPPNIHLWGMPLVTECELDFKPVFITICNQQVSGFSTHHVLSWWRTWFKQLSVIFLLMLSYPQLSTEIHNLPYTL